VYDDGADDIDGAGFERKGTPGVAHLIFFYSTLGVLSLTADANFARDKTSRYKWPMSENGMKSDAI